MFAYISRRLAVSFFILLAASFAVYVIFAFLPFDPAALTCGKNCNDPGIIEANRRRLGYDLPFFTQYFLFLKGLFFGRTFGEGAALINCPAPSLGYSFQQHACVTNLIGEALPVTFSLAIGAIVMWLALGIGLGILAARFRGRFVDRLSTIFVLIGTSLPTFLTGLLLLVFVVIRWGLIPFPSGNYTSFFENPFEWAQILFLPWLTLAFAYAALYTRFVRSSVIDTSNEDYIRTARAKGLSEREVVSKHALRNALLPVATVVGLSLGGLLSGAVLTETIFGFAGIGRTISDAITARDYVVVQGVTVIVSVGYVVVNLIVDISYAYLDPRVRINS